MEQLELEGKQALNEEEAQEGWKRWDSQAESRLLQHGLLLQLLVRCLNYPVGKKYHYLVNKYYWKLKIITSLKTNSVYILLPRDKFIRC